MLSSRGYKTNLSVVKRHTATNLLKGVAEQAPQLVYPWTSDSDDLKELSFPCNFIGLLSMRK